MKKVVWALVLVLGLCFVSACGDSGGDGDDAFKMNNLPDNYSIKLPNSIDGSKKTSRAVGDDSVGAMEIRNATEEMMWFSVDAQVNALIADVAISDYGVTADEQSHKASVKLTQEMIDLLAEMTGEDLSEYLGVTMDFDIVFSDNLTGTYKYCVEISMTYDDGTTQKNSIFWSEDKKKTKTLTPIYVSTEPAPEPSRADEADGYAEFVFDADQKLMTLAYKGSAFTMEMSIKEQGEGALFFSSSNAGSYVYRIEGYADDNGGYCKYSQTSSSGVNKGEECFDANGKITESNSSYQGSYSSGAEVIGDLMFNVGITKTGTSLADGEYLVMNNSATLSGGFNFNNVIGYAMVVSGNLVIQDLGGLAYSDLVSAMAAGSSPTVYLFKATSNFWDDFEDPASSFAASPIEVTLP